MYITAKCDDNPKININYLQVFEIMRLNTTENNIYK